MQNQDLCKLYKLCESLSPYDVEREDMRKLYALYKQFMVGDCNAEESTELKTSPNFAAWKSLQGKPKSEAIEEYYDLIEKIKKDQEKD